MVFYWLSRLGGPFELLRSSSEQGMTFCSDYFPVYFALLFALYWALPWERARVWLLLAASLDFYASWSGRLALVVVASATLDYFLARAIEAVPTPAQRRLLVAVSVAANLGLLCYFKYVNFFLGSLHLLLDRCGFSTAFTPLSLLAPIGISFYTFEAISYVVDVAAGRLRAERRLTHFLLFILFFPHLLAGPIVRGRDFLPQIARGKRWSWLRLQLGIRFFLMGLFKKYVVANRMALFVDPVFADPAGFRTSAVWLAVLAYALQIYCDFSGYTDMALGTAHALGYRLAQNFDLPYLACNVSEFWRRWHISLSSWLRDYLFIPLGGSRLGNGRTLVNLLVVMTLGGLWHGASWTFVGWGVLHGLFLVIHRLFAAFCRARPSWQRCLQSLAGTAARRLLTLGCVCLGWVFFRAQTFGLAVAVLRGLCRVQPGRSEPLPSISFLAAAAILVVCHLLGQDRRPLRLLERVPGPVLGMGYAGLLTACMVLMPSVGQPFIYFHF